jgi:biotin carboxyl carrier protein
VPNTPEGRRAIGRVAEKVLPALIARLSASELGELEVREGDWRVRLRRDSTTGGNPTKAAADGMERAAGATSGIAGDRPTRAERGLSGDRDRGASPRAAASRRAISAPAVGYFTPRQGLAVGQPIRAGDVLGHVDVLGVPVDVVAPTDGRLGRLYATAGEAVEYGQELVRLDGVETGVTAVGPGEGTATVEAADVGTTGATGATAADPAGAVDREGTEGEADVGIESVPAAMVE